MTTDQRCETCGLEGEPLHDDWVPGHLICDWCEWEMYGCLLGEEGKPKYQRPERAIGHWYWPDATGAWREHAAVVTISRPYEVPERLR